jgi:hypothetical protein
MVQVVRVAAVVKVSQQRLFGVEGISDQSFRPLPAVFWRSLEARNLGIDYLVFALVRLVECQGAAIRNDWVKMDALFASWLDLLLHWGQGQTTAEEATSYPHFAMSRFHCLPLEARRGWEVEKEPGCC